MNIREVKSVEEVAQVLAAAQADNDCILNPTHFVEANGKIVGGASVDGVCVLCFWSKRDNDKMISFRFAKQMIREAKKTCKKIIVTCSPDSPFVKYLPDLGFEKIGNTDLWKDGAK